MDAFPVHVLRWDALERRWREWGVGLKGGDFAWQRMATDVASWHAELQCAGLEVPAPLAAYLPDGFTVEFSPDAADWWRKAAGCLREGKLVAIDYGGNSDELLAPQRHHGTLRAYAHHRTVDDVLANPGGQDLTAHVNFTQLRRVAEGEGLVTEAFLTQNRFLTRIFEKASGTPRGLGEWTPARTRQWQTLTHPEHLGRPFRVLIQSR
jgi:SAM-dependent MidA family methyltransferase